MIVCMSMEEREVRREVGKTGKSREEKRGTVKYTDLWGRGLGGFGTCSVKPTRNISSLVPRPLSLLRYSSHMTNGILLTRHNQEITQWSPDPFPCEKVGLGTRLLGTRV